jgi:hypothetical protein
LRKIFDYISHIPGVTLTPQEENVVKHLLLSSAAAMVVLTVASPAFPGTITLDFGSLVSTATDAQIQSYIDGLLPAGDSVVVTGAAGSCNTNGNGCPYQADGHIVGPLSGNTVTSYTLPIRMAGRSSVPGAILSSAAQTRLR